MKAPIYLDADAAAKYLDEIGAPITAGGLANLRHEKRGPKYTKVSGRIRYTREWLDDYIAACAVTPPPPPRPAIRARA